MCEPVAPRGGSMPDIIPDRPMTDLDALNGCCWRRVKLTLAAVAPLTAPAKFAGWDQPAAAKSALVRWAVVPSPLAVMSQSSGLGRPWLAHQR